MKKIFLLLIISITSLAEIYCQWEVCNNGLPQCSVPSIAIDGDRIFAGTSNGIYLSTDNGDNWSPLITWTDPFEVRSIAIIGNNIFAGTFGNGLLLSTDNGTNWKNCAFPHSGIQTIAVSDNKIFIGKFYDGVYLSTDMGNTWIEKHNGLHYITADISVNSIAIKDNNIFAGTSQGIFLSTDNGDNWIKKKSSQYEVMSIVFSGDNIFAGMWEIGVYKSTDNGENWISKGKGLAVGRKHTIAVVDNYLFTGIWGFGLYLSSDNGENWVVNNSGLSDFQVIAISNTNEYIFVGTIGGGVFRAKLSALVVSVEDNIIPSNNNFSISPNPATDYIDITLASKISSNKNDDIKIYNVLGDKVHSVSFQNPESQRIDISTLPAGLYYCVINSGSNRYTNKFMIVR
jgi:photosystem II stability/assembly factor-like uncharacterized protein